MRKIEDVSKAITKELAKLAKDPRTPEDVGLDLIARGYSNETVVGRCATCPVAQYLQHKAKWPNLIVASSSVFIYDDELHMKLGGAWKQRVELPPAIQRVISFLDTTPCRPTA